MTQIPELVLQFAVLIVSVVLHEVAHGYSAFLLGDPTAKNAGRLSLNPLKHADPFGTVLLPLILLGASGGAGPVFGYAKPVPFNPRYFRNPRRGELIVGLVGPGTNLAIALVGTVLWRAALALPTNPVTYWVAIAGLQFVIINLVLMFFNALPIPPLDGASIYPLFLSDSQMRTYRQIERHGFFILILLLWVIPSFTGFDPLGIYFDWTVSPLLRLLLG